MNNENKQYPEPKPLTSGIIPPPYLATGLILRATIRLRQSTKLSLIALMVLLNVGIMEFCNLRITHRSFRDFMLSLSKNKVKYYFDGLLDRGFVSTYKEGIVVCYVVTDRGNSLLNDINDDYELFTRKLFGL